MTSCVDDAVDKKADENHYAPVACFALVRIVHCISVSMDWGPYQVGVKGAFLYADLPESERVIWKLPNIDGVDVANENVVELRKYL